MKTLLMEGMNAERKTSYKVIRLSKLLEEKCVRVMERLLLLLHLGVVSDLLAEATAHLSLLKLLVRLRPPPLA